MTRSILGSIAALLAIVLYAAGPAVAQTTTTTKDVRKFEVISVDGNNLVVRDEKGTEEYTVPADFRFKVDGKDVTVADLKPGMKGTATITKTTTTRPVYVTTIKMGTVVSQSGRSVVVEEDTGQTHRFSQSEADARDIQIYVDGKPVRIFNLSPGDKITATIVSAGAPEILTAQDVDATLEKAGEAAAGGEVGTGATTAVAPAAASKPAAVDTSPNVVAAAAADEKPTAQNKQGWFWILVFVVAAIVTWLLLSNRSKPKPA